MDPSTDIARSVARGPLVATVSDVIAETLLDDPRPMWLRSVFDPGHFTASGFVASPDGGSLLLIEHRRLRRWLQPGGHFEPEDSSVDAAARREVLEETGLGDLVRLDERLLRIDAHPIPARGGEPAHTHVDLAIAYRSTSWSIGPCHEVEDARWVPFDDLVSYDTDAAVLNGADALAALLANTDGGSGRR
jgi:8-oxo-dGTP pyrophosphatase MutT (NUDIX family)